MDAFVLAFLVELLGHPSWACREQAHTALAARGKDALPALVQARTHADPEIRHRARLLTDAWLGSFGPSKGGPLPWIDMAGEDVDCPKEIQDRYLLKARGEDWNYSNTDGDWPDYRQATALLIRDLVEAGWSREKVVALLDRMAAREQIYRDKQTEVIRPPQEQS